MASPGGAWGILDSHTDLLLQVHTRLFAPQASLPALSEPDFSYLEALAPYQPLAMKCIYCPIDTRLNFIQVSKLLKEVQVRTACVCVWVGG